MSTPTTARRLMPQSIDDWPDLVMTPNPRPMPADPVTDELRHGIDAYNQKIGTIATHDTRAVSEAIRRAHFENDHAAYGSATTRTSSGCRATNRKMCGSTNRLTT